MAFTPTSLMLIELKMLLGIGSADDSQNEYLNLLLEQTATKILNEILQDSLPTMLEPILVEIAADAYKLSRGEAIGTISSMSDNGQSVSFTSDAILRSVATVLKDYTGQLDRFRKPGW